MNFFETDTLTALQSKEKAQWIAFAPFVFQTTRVLRDTGILTFVAENPKGVTQHEIVSHTGLTRYGVRVLVEGALGIGLLTCKDGVYKITKTGFFILHDKLTEVNLDFTHDVCYKGLFNLEESIRHEKPEGLKVFGEWPTVYEGLSKLPPEVQKSWFAFDHYYSDVAFPEVLPYVYANKPGKLLDIGGNTGKWTMASLAYDPDVDITIMDLPGQVGMAKKQIEEKGFGHRIHFYETNILNESLPFPTGFDAIWMSQFLDCFSEEQIISILKRCREALNPGGLVYILEPFWDRQRFEISAFALQQTSLYFTAMANGNSQMYQSENFVALVEAAGYTVVQEVDGIGVSHTLLVCQPE
jgi:SAM-dependent methyltransferase